MFVILNISMLHYSYKSDILFDLIPYYINVITIFVILNISMLHYSYKSDILFDLMRSTSQLIKSQLVYIKGKMYVLVNLM